MCWNKAKQMSHFPSRNDILQKTHFALIIAISYNPVNSLDCG